MENIMYYNERKVNKGQIWLLFLFLGWSYGSLGKMGKQILFYLTLGGFGIGTLIRFFTLNPDIRKYNSRIALECGLTQEEILRMGLDFPKNRAEAKQVAELIKEEVKKESVKVKETTPIKEAVIIEAQTVKSVVAEKKAIEKKVNDLTTKAKLSGNSFAELFEIADRVKNGRSY